jgi:hypothetical protein
MMDLKKQISEGLRQDLTTRRKNIEVLRSNGTITIQGIVSSFYEKQMAQEIALRVIRSHESENGNGNGNGNGHINLRVHIDVQYNKGKFTKGRS